QDNHLCNRQICEVPRVSMRRSHPHQDSVRLDGILASHRGVLVRRRKITLVQDNLNTHTAGPVHESLPPARARELLERFEFIYTPKHGSWLNMAEIEINSLIKQCLDRRIPDIEQMRAEVAAWQRQRNDANQVMRWRFTTDDTRIKLHRLYPTIEG
ncbi:MAG: transposase, partial [Opitutaceae bacterium]|nr:transposase [Opitutaceae bacterium]